MRSFASTVVMFGLAAALCGCAPGGTIALESSSVGEASAASAASLASGATKSVVAGPSSGGAPPAAESSAEPMRQPASGTLTSPGPGGGSVGATSPRASAPTTTAIPTLARSRPVRIQVPAIGVDSGLLDLGLQDDGTMEVPPDASSLGWFTGAPTPGQLGPAVIVGHVDWAGELGSFYDLGKLKPGDLITVSREDGSSAIFRVNKRGQYAKDEFPTDAVYANTDHAALRLITCGGEFDHETGNYLDNIIVFADMGQTRL